MKKTVILLSLLMPNLFTAQTLTVTITGLRNTSGNLSLGFYTDNESFKKEAPTFVKIEAKTKAVNGVLILVYSNVRPGTYGIALMDDENSNGKMDYGLILPNEGFGFSNYYHTGLTRPEYSKFSFNLKDESKKVEIKVRYL